MGATISHKRVCTIHIRQAWILPHKATILLPRAGARGALGRRRREGGGKEEEEEEEKEEEEEEEKKEEEEEEEEAKGLKL